MQIKKKNIPFIILLFVLLFLIVFLYIGEKKPNWEFSIIKKKLEQKFGVTNEKQQEESNIIKFSFPITPHTFSLPFTPYTQKYMNLRLQAIKCTPDQYYKDNNQVCFICGSFDVCMEYGLVERTGGKMMSITGESLAGNYDMEIELNFKSYGIFKLLNCKCNEGCICDNGTKVTLGERNPVFVFPEGINLEDKIKEIGQMIGEECSRADGKFECGWLGVSILDENKISFDIII